MTVINWTGPNKKIRRRNEWTVDWWPALSSLVNIFMVRAGQRLNSSFSYQRHFFHSYEFSPPVSHFPFFSLEMIWWWNSMNESWRWPVGWSMIGTKINRFAHLIANLWIISRQAVSWTTKNESRTLLSSYAFYLWCPGFNFFVHQLTQRPNNFFYSHIHKTDLFIFFICGVVSLNVRE